MYSVYAQVQFNITQPVAQKDVYKFSFFPRTLREWKLLPASVTDADKLEEFSVRIQNLPKPLYEY
jgi:hypothetical protein